MNRPHGARCGMQQLLPSHATAGRKIRESPESSEIAPLSRMARVAEAPETQAISRQLAEGSDPARDYRLFAAAVKSCDTQDSSGTEATRSVRSKPRP